MENRLSFKGANNTRDLGGCVARYGDIGDSGNGGNGVDAENIVAYGRLIRSGELSRMNAASCRILTERYGVRTLVDLRTDGEAARRPLPDELKNAAVHIPILRQAMRGITRDDETLKHKIEAVTAAGLSEREFMRSNYSEMISEPGAREGYRRLFGILLGQREGATVFFCSQGRDRTGIAAMLILSALGVSEEEIYRDYMLPPPELHRRLVCLRALRAARLLDRGEAAFAREWLMPDAGRLDGALDMIKREYGSVGGYLASGIGLGGDELTRLRQMYLTRRVTL